MATSYIEDRKNHRTSLLASAKSIAENALAAGRSLSSDEQSTIDSAISAARAITNEIEAHHAGAAKSKGVFDSLDSMARSAAGQGGPLSDQRLTFGKGLADRIVDKMLGDGGAKALATSGVVLTGAEFFPDPIGLGRPANGLLDILPVIRHERPQYQVLVQTARTNKAAEVADHALKPT